MAHQPRSTLGGVVEFCSVDDPRHRRWLRECPRIWSPVAKVRLGAAESLRAMGFEVALGTGMAETEHPPVRSRGLRWLRRQRLWHLALWVAMLLCGLRIGVNGYRKARRSRALCGLPTEAGGACRLPADSCPYRRAGTHSSQYGSGQLATVSGGLDHVSSGYESPQEHASLYYADLANSPGGIPAGVAAAAVICGDAGLTARPPGEHEKLVRADDLLRLLTGIARGVAADGFTVSPFDPTASPDSGVCVALDNSPLMWGSDQGNAFDESGEPNDAFAEKVGEWLADFEPALASGDVWVGGWVDPVDGTVEMNVTCVFDAACEDLGQAFGELQDQQSVYVIGSGSQEGRLVNTYGSGGSPWQPRPDEAAAVP